MRYNTNGYNNGRNGFDSLSRFLTIVGLIILVASIVLRIFHLGIFGLVLSIIAIILFIYAYSRALSRNIFARHTENQAYLNLISGMKRNWNNRKDIHNDKKINKVVKCPNCGQKIRIPKGKGLLQVKCPNCRIEFRVNSGKKQYQ